MCGRSVAGCKPNFARTSAAISWTRCHSPRIRDLACSVMGSRRSSARFSMLSCRQERLELQVSESQGRGFSRHIRSADVLGWEVFECSVDDAGAVEARDDRHPSRHRRGVVPADLLQPAEVELDVRSGRCEGVLVVCDAPREIAPQV